VTDPGPGRVGRLDRVLVWSTAVGAAVWLVAGSISAILYRAAIEFPGTGPVVAAQVLEAAETIAVRLWVGSLAVLVARWVAARPRRSSA
jgi:hypothetical protein